MPYSCRYCADGRIHPVWVYLARDRRIPNDRLGSMYAYVGMSRHPLHRLAYNQNRAAGWRVGSKSTKSIAPHWQLEMVVGPFYNGQGDAFKNGWRKGARRFRRRVRFGVDYGVKNGVKVYCRDVALIRKILDE
jgi:hypothetical protein